MKRISSGQLFGSIVAYINIAVLIYAAWYLAHGRLPSIFIFFSTVILILFGLSNFRSLVFITTLILMLNQTSIGGLRAFLNNIRWVALSSMGILFFLKFFSRAYSRTFKKFDAIIMSFIIYAFISSLYSISPEQTVERSATLMLLYIAVFWMIWGYAGSISKVREMIGAILDAAFVLYITNFVYLVAGGSSFVDGRFCGIMENPNSIGLLTAIIFPLVLRRSLEYGKIFDKLFIVIILATLIWSESRTGLFATAAASAYIMYHKLKKHRLFVASLCIFIAIVAVIPHEYYLNEKVIRFLRLESFYQYAARFEAWRAAMGLIRERPLFGYGFGTEDMLFDYFGIFFDYHKGAYSHNSYLGMALQLGLLGAALFFIPLFFVLLKRLFAAGSQSLISASLTAVLISALIASFSESWLYSVGNSVTFPFWICLMLLVRINSEGFDHDE